MTLTSYRHSPDDVARRLAFAGLRVHVRALREPELDHESTPQAFVLAHRAAGDHGPRRVPGPGVRER